MSERYKLRFIGVDIVCRMVYDTAFDREMAPDEIVERLNQAESIRETENNACIATIDRLTAELDAAKQELAILHEVVDRRRNKSEQVDRKIRESLSASVERLAAERDALAKLADEPGGFPIPDPTYRGLIKRLDDAKKGGPTS